MNPVIGKYLIGLGAVLTLIGLIVYFWGDKPGWPGLSWPGLSWLGRLPGDIRVEGRSGGFYVPLVTCLVVSLLLNLIIGLIRRFFGS